MKYLARLGRQQGVAMHKPGHNELVVRADGVWHGQLGCPGAAIAVWGHGLLNATALLAASLGLVA